MLKKIKHDIQNDLLRIQSIINIIINNEESPFSDDQLLKDLKISLGKIEKNAEQYIQERNNS